MVYPFKGNLVDIESPPHRCSMPKIPWYRRGKQWAGYIAQCECGRKYKWEKQYSWHEYLGWGWTIL